MNFCVTIFFAKMFKCVEEATKKLNHILLVQTVTYIWVQSFNKLLTILPILKRFYEKEKDQNIVWINYWKLWSTIISPIMIYIGHDSKHTDFTIAKLVCGVLFWMTNPAKLLKGNCISITLLNIYIISWILNILLFVLCRRKFIILGNLFKYNFPLVPIFHQTFSHTNCKCSHRSYK